MGTLSFHTNNLLTFGLATNLITKMVRIAYCRPKTSMSENNSCSTSIDSDLEIDEDDFMFKMEHLKNNSYQQI